MADRSFSVAIVGAGLMGRWHLDAARRSGARIAAIVDTDPTRSRALGGEYTNYTSLAAALATPVDVVHICTPAGSHASLCHESVAAGCHVIVEKPATLTGREADTLQAAAQAAGRMVVPVHQFVFQRGVQEIRHHLPMLGPIRQFEFATASAGSEATGQDPDAVAAEILPHPLALARNLLGIEVATLRWQVECAGAGEWRMHAITPDGDCAVTANISMSVRPPFATCRLFGENGAATADLFHGFATFERGGAGRAQKLARPFVVGLGTAAAGAANLVRRAVTGEPAYPGLRALVTASYAAMRGEQPAPFRDDELVDVARARDELIRLAGR